MAKNPTRLVKSARLSVVSIALLFLVACSSKEEQAQSYLDSGRNFLAGQNNVKAIIEFRNALKLNKNLLPAWRGMAQAQEALQDWDSLLPVLKTILSLEPGDSVTRVKLAKFLIVGNAPDQAITLIDDAPASDAKLLAVKALGHLRSNQGEVAVNEARSALKADPGNADAVLVLGEDLLAHRDAQGALQLLERETAGHPKELQTESLKLAVYANLGDYKRLESGLKEISGLYPKEEGFKRRLVELYLFQGRTKDAEQVLRELAAMTPGLPQPALDVVQLLNQTQGPDRARRELADLIEKSQDPTPYQLAMVDLDIKQGQPDNARALLDKLLASKNPKQIVNAKLALSGLELQQKNAAKAEEILGDILKDDSRNVDALRLRASLWLNSGQIDRAVSDLRVALNEQPHAPDLMLLLATAYERSGTIDLAEKEFADALKDSKFNADVGLSYVGFLNRRGRSARAATVLADLASRYPTNRTVVSALAELKLSQQDWKGAEALAETVKGLGDAAFADQIIGTSLSYQKKYDASFTALQSAVDAAPTAAEPLVTMVGALVRAKKTDEAISFLRKALDKNPDNAQAYTMLGEIAFSKGDLTQAESNFKAAIDRQPKLDVGYRALSDFYRRQGKWDRAFEVANAGLAKDPNDAVLHLAVASTYESKGDYEAAIGEYEKLLKIDPGSMLVTNNLASLLADRRDDEASLERARLLTANLQETDVVQFKDTLGWVYARKGDFRSAIPLLEAASSRLRNVPAVHYHLGVSYLGIGEQSKGINELKFALELNPDRDLEARIKARLNRTPTQ